MYTAQRMTVPRIARSLGFSIGTVRSRLADCGLLTTYVPHNLKTEIQDAEIVRMYREENKTMVEIAENFKCSKSGIRKRLLKAGVLDEPQQVAKRYRKFNLTENELRDLYIDKQKSDEQIGRELDVCNITIANWRRKWGIKRTQPVHQRDLPVNELKDMYVDKKMSMQKISEHFDCALTTVRSHIVKHGLGISSAEESARVLERNREKYSRRFKISGYWRIKMTSHPNANRDGYIDEHRYVAEGAIGRYLEFNEQVHHINTIKDDNRPENLAVIKGREDHARVHKYMERAAAYLLKLADIRPDPIQFANPCFWAGQWVTTIDLLPAD